MSAPASFGPTPPRVPLRGHVTDAAVDSGVTITAHLHMDDESGVPTGLIEIGSSTSLLKLHTSLDGAARLGQVVDGLCRKLEAVYEAWASNRLSLVPDAETSSR